MSSRRLAAKVVLGLSAGLLLAGGCGRTATWAPDSQSVLVDAGGKLHLFSLSSRLFRPVDLGGRYAFSAAFSPDGRQIAYYGITGEKGQATCDVWVQDLSRPANERLIGAGVLTVHGSPEDAADNKGLLRVSWSPDGTQLAYTRFNEERGRIEVVELASGEVTRLGRGVQTQFMPAWSPGGTHLAFVAQESGDSGGNSFAVYLARPWSSEPPRRVNPDPDAGYWPAWPLTWSTDGTEIAALRVPKDGSASLVVLDADNGAERKLLDIESVDGSITPDFTRVVYMGGTGDAEVVFRAAPFTERRVVDRIDRKDAPFNPLVKPKVPLHPVLSDNGGTVALPILNGTPELRLYELGTGVKSTFRIP